MTVRLLSRSPSAMAGSDVETLTREAAEADAAAAERREGKRKGRKKR